MPLPPLAWQAGARTDPNGVYVSNKEAAEQCIEPAVDKHLWEYDHPYYCAEGNYFKRGQHALFGSWDEFVDTTLFFSGDRDQNLLIRWDWHSWRRNPDEALRSDSPDVLLLFFVLQRKALLCSAGITVTDDDEPRVRWFLEDCARTAAAIWEPVALVAEASRG